MRRHQVNPNDSKRFDDWLARAYEDMISAKHLKDDERCYNSCAFHCQQCIEKALKAYLLLVNKQLVDGHNLTWLCRQAVKQDSAFTEWLDESASLNKYYIETRYPSDIGLNITAQDIDKAYKMAKEMYIFICRQVHEEDPDIEIAKTVKKGHSNATN